MYVFYCGDHAFFVVPFLWILTNIIFSSPWLFLCAWYHTAIRGMRMRAETQQIKEERAKKTAIKVAQKCMSFKWQFLEFFLFSYPVSRNDSMRLLLHKSVMSSVKILETKRKQTETQRTQNSIVLLQSGTALKCVCPWNRITCWL